jgi:ArsR family transcriptional regulator
MVFALFDPLSFFKCLADDTRLKSLLLIAQQGPLCVCDLVSALSLSQPKVSRHLADLRNCNLLLGERRGKWVFYQLHPELPDWAKDVLLQTASNNIPYIQSHLTILQDNASCC